jgi:hypothetical protein
VADELGNLEARADKVDDDARLVAGYAHASSVLPCRFSCGRLVVKVEPSELKPIRDNKLPRKLSDEYCFKVALQRSANRDGLANSAPNQFHVTLRCGRPEMRPYACWASRFK